MKLRSLDPNFLSGNGNVFFQVDETACFPKFQENIVNFPVFSLFTLDFDVSCSASVFDFFVELVKNSLSFLFLLISLHFFFLVCLVLSHIIICSLKKRLLAKYCMRKVMLSDFAT